MAEKKYVIFTDIKEFTYKNGLLTNQQIEKMLWVFDSIVSLWAWKYDISIVKSMWDAYLCLADDALSAYDFTKYILAETQKYDDKEKIEIKRIALRASITYWEVAKNKAMNLDDYFGESINLASRIITITPKWKIFCTQEVKESLKTTIYSQDIGEHSFHGVLLKTQLYSLVKIWNEEEFDINVDKRTLLEECDVIVFRSACVSAILSSQPVPFIENFNIIGIHLYMTVKLSQKMERGITLRSSWKIIKEVVSPVWIGYFSLHGSNTLAKIILPWIGWYLFSPLSFGVTYAMWKVYTAYLFHSIAWESLDNSQIKNIFLKQRQTGKNLAKKEKRNILKTGKNFYKDVLWIKKESGYSDVQKDLLKMLRNKEK